MAGASEPDPVSTKQQQIAELAKQDPQRGLFSLAHHIDLRWLYEAYLRVRKTGPRAWTAKQPRTIQRTLGTTCGRCWNGPKQLKVKAELAGKKIKCSQCGSVMSVT